MELFRIDIPRLNLKITPSNSDQWQIAKLFLMQGAHYLIKFAKHPYVHFPLDAVISITNSVFPIRSSPSSITLSIRSSPSRPDRLSHWSSPSSIETGSPIRSSPSSIQALPFEFSFIDRQALPFENL